MKEMRREMNRVVRHLEANDVNCKIILPGICFDCDMNYGVNYIRRLISQVSKEVWYIILPNQTKARGLRNGTTGSD